MSTDIGCLICTPNHWTNPQNAFKSGSHTPLMNIKGFVPRLYQETIFSSCTKRNSLVVLPTGLGKTNVFLMLTAHRLSLHPDAKILLLGPTRPLIEQYKAVFQKYLDIEEEKMAIFTGHVTPAKREKLWKTSQIVFSTPQGLENDIIARRIDLKEVALLGIDESHRAVGDYAYVFVAKRYQELSRYPLITGLTASPGSDMAKIEEVCQNLFIENVEVRTNADPDVKPYIKDVKVDWVEVRLPKELMEIREIIKKMIEERMSRLKEWGVLKKKSLGFVSRTEIIAIQAQLRGRAASGEKDFTLWTAISVLAEVMKLFHGIELLESQGIIPLHNYLEGIFKESFKTKTKATINIAKDPEFRKALIKTESLAKAGIVHPKMDAMLKTVEEEFRKTPDTKILIFNQFRDNVSDIVSRLGNVPGVRPSLFVGQAKKNGTGLNQKKQKELIERFSKGEFNVVVSTSIGEEGLDIPKVDTVIFYEPIPSAIRSIQRRGRTGRLDEGKVIIFMTKDTRDETYKWSAHHKENRMYRNLEKIKKKLDLKCVATGLCKYQEDPVEEVKVHVDHREKANAVVKHLIDKGIQIELGALENADYVLSKRVGVEYKKVEDFVNSLLDGRLLQQLKDMRKHFERPLVIIEGESDLYSVRNLHPNAIRGMLATITVSYGIPIIQTKNGSETASLMKVIARREQIGDTKEFDPHFGKKKASQKEQLEYVVSSIPGIGITTARDLLTNFGSIKRILDAEEELLKKVEKVGPKTAKTIKETFEADYNDL
jgi:ERCC4-related helicase